MPAIINGPVSIDNITTDGNVKFGDSIFLTPKTDSKAYAGSGGFNSGGAVISNTGVNATNYVDPDVVDQPVYGNN
ncbi:spore germination protein [Bacillus salipaludis]|uniref:Spore germination protein n=1 Tax=Bacillus salipaludis TaxID=2547811 RepID=A0A4R5VYH9_9BACI|nr:spore germination protein [Bacillus salipaludis]MDQ6595061.1 spore germination protein [Bacillus salipaludis]TDK64086.1 spore germination protein [Bacillus salipaludis]